ncbi:UbiA family prenyltransferase [Pseudorhodoferax sp. Leaf267]|uniref:UbiA family prenyltransferase n=1 Tax=Pseudorhodoferax sp. Leaf267 TaxID=1736316 RepID=UPI0006F63580|nr:UbiA family prenyltransferase [Pseudorhodoferax sp. Leaf267]KQP23143.1 4-hydroxybenzoate polyprenyltransferase [Pseudorhodoferax sp. Leaf267]
MPSPQTPLVVDLDGTLTATDTLVESVMAMLKRRPWMLLQLLLWLLAGRSGFKQRVAGQVRLQAGLLPWRGDLLDWLRAQRAGGRRLVLATAAHESIAHAVADELQLFDQVLATRDGHNLKGAAKLEAIEQQVGADFAYAGDSRADLPIWQAARGAVLVGVSASVARAVQASGTPVEKNFARPGGRLRLWVRAMRVHQWAKNLLILVPLFTSFSFGDSARVGAAALAFFAFSLAASATYLLNDLWDLDSDRQHPRKKRRPFASAELPLLHGVAGAAVLLLLAFALALQASLGFALMLLGYVVLTTAYSWALKHYVLLDVLVLAVLYTYRVLAGSVVTGIPVTPWLLSFSVFTFFSLALVKRCAELVLLQQGGRTGAHGRDYQVGDLVVLWPLGIGASLCSVVVFGLYVGSAEALGRYANIDLLWLVGIGLLYWSARLWIKTARGQMHDDPLVFALRDVGSRVSVLAMVCVTVLARLTG